MIYLLAALAGTVIGIPIGWHAANRGQPAARPTIPGDTVNDWTPPPPGDRREQLPDHLLAAIDAPPYTSTACQTADLLADAIPGLLDLAGELGEWADRLHGRCRLNQKFTGQQCVCSCHNTADTNT